MTYLNERGRRRSLRRNFALLNIFREAMRYRVRVSHSDELSCRENAARESGARSSSSSNSHPVSPLVVSFTRRGIDAGHVGDGIAVDRSRRASALRMTDRDVPRCRAFLISRRSISCTTSAGISRTLANSGLSGAPIGPVTFFATHVPEKQRRAATHPDAACAFIDSRRDARAAAYE